MTPATIALSDVLKAAGDFFRSWLDDKGRCVHPCCPSPCLDPKHTQHTIDWPPIAQQVIEAEIELAEHRGPLDLPHRLDCHECRVLEAFLHDARLTAEMVAVEP